MTRAVETARQLSFVLGCALATACTGGASGPGQPVAPADSATPTNTSNAGASGTASTECSGTNVAVERRVVRLTLRQATSSIRLLLGADAADAVEKTYEVGSASARAFPPLSSQQEGTFVTEILWSKNEGIARAAAQYLTQNYASLTGCAAEGDDDTCAKAFVARFAERAFRRPLDGDETDSLLQVFTESRANGASSREATEQAAWATLSSPHFLYRRELGVPGAAGANVHLTDHELAGVLSFFLTDGPPDEPLLQAAASGALATTAGVGSQVDRLLSMPSAQLNLQQAMLTYFGIGNLDAVVIDPAKAPTFTVGLKNAMYRETEEFLHTTLSSGPLGDLLTSRKTVVNADLAALYGVAFPAGQSTASDNFVAVELPAGRAGLLTQAGFLTARARPDKDSVVARGLMVTATMLCAENPSQPPDALKDQIDTAVATLADKTEREKADFRAAQPTCGACHRSFDAYGLVLQNFDLIGQHRDTDDRGRVIDASATLPADVGGAQVAGAADMAAAITKSGAFIGCMARHLTRYALAEGNVNRSDCAVQNVAQRVLAGPQTFASLVKEIAMSETLSTRNNGVAP